MNDVVATNSQSEVVQQELGAQDGLGLSDIPTSGMETIYMGSQLCPSCGKILNPVQVLWGSGLCPDCQARKNAALVKDRMVQS